MGNVWGRLRRAWKNRLGQRITRSGAAYLFALALTTTAAFLSANNLIFLITSSMMAALLVSGFVNRLSLSGLEVEFHPPEHLFAREQAAAKIVVRNEKSWMPSFATRLQSIHADGLTQPLYFAVIGGGETVSEFAPVRFSRRGRFRDNSLEFTSRFPFGFAERRARVTLHADVLVYPALVPAPATQDLLARVEGAIQARRTGPGDEFYLLRPYLPADAARRIDWRSSARHGELHVREHAQEDSLTVHIILDLYVSAEGSQWLEHALETVSWLCTELEAKNVPYSLRTQERTISVPSGGDLYSVLRYLAIVESTPFGSGGDLERLIPQDDEAIVFVLTPDPARAPAGPGIHTSS